MLEQFNLKTDLYSLLYTLIIILFTILIIFINKNNIDYLIGTQHNSRKFIHISIGLIYL
jgi:hypothetical protein